MFTIDTRVQFYSTFRFKPLYCIEDVGSSSNPTNYSAYVLPAVYPISYFVLCGLYYWRYMLIYIRTTPEPYWFSESPPYISYHHNMTTLKFTTRVFLLMQTHNWRALDNVEYTFSCVFKPPAPLPNKAIASFIIWSSLCFQYRYSISQWPWFCQCITHQVIIYYQLYLSLTNPSILIFFIIITM